MNIIPLKALLFLLSYIERPFPADLQLLSCSSNKRKYEAIKKQENSGETRRSWNVQERNSFEQRSYVNFGTNLLLDGIVRVCIVVDRHCVSSVDVKA